MRLAPRLAAMSAPIFLVAACSGGSASPSASLIASPSETPLSSEAATSTPVAPSQDVGDGAVVVTFRVADAEEYRILLTDPEDIATAERLLAGEEAPSIPNGMIVRGGDGGVNTGYSWHIDPESLEFAEVTTEVCDGRPSYVEDRTLTGEWFCPWSAEVVEIEPAG
ncbi:MAG TPA: hypothetical protein VF071_06570 [Candidatus Limnocylindria bacterium]